MCIYECIMYVYLFCAQDNSKCSQWIPKENCMLGRLSSLLEVIGFWRPAAIRRDPIQDPHLTDQTLGVTLQYRATEFSMITRQRQRESL